MPGSLIGNRFEIQRIAGSGGMGTVYRAIDHYSGDTVALKLLRSDQVEAEDAKRFLREAQLLTELHHPGIVNHIAHGRTADGQHFLAMEWLDGEDLGQRLAQGPLPVQDCLRIIEQVADALASAHELGIIHRDIKPTNLFLIGQGIGRVKILDFGIARRIATTRRITQTGTIIGTPEYMSPEQARGNRDLTPAADLFSLGCVLYECLTGEPPFVASHIAAVLARILLEEPIPLAERRPEVPGTLSSLVARLLAKQPDHRMADAGALRTELLRLGEPSDLPPAPTINTPKPNNQSFAEQEQCLFSIVLAGREEELGADAAPCEARGQLAPMDKQALLQSLTGLGGAPDFLANGTLVVTVPPLGSAQDQATVAARAALVIRERWPDAVVAMATGRGVVRGNTAMGEVVEVAVQSLKSRSRMPARKSPTGVLIDALSSQLLEGRFAQLQHPDGSLTLHEERLVDASRPLLGKPTPCVGREAELGTLELQLSGCIEESEARVLLITAQPGVGKSRLRHEFLRRVEKRSEPVTMMLGLGDMMSAGAPYGILRTTLHRLCGISGSDSLEVSRQRLRQRIGSNVAAADQERIVSFIGELCNIPFPGDGQPLLLAARQDPKIMKDCLRSALLDWLAAECAASPVLIVLDDIQWADELTVSALAEVLQKQSGAPLLIVALARPEVHQTFPKLWKENSVHEIPLNGLSRKASERLIQQVLGKEISREAIARVVEQSAGNALFLEELVRALSEKSEGNPQTVLAMLQARIGRLDPGARRAIRAASIFGQTFWRGGIAALLGVHSTAPELKEWLSLLTDAELIQSHAQSRLPNEKEYGFRHALVRDAAYALLTTGDLATGHLRAARFLEATGSVDALAIAEHFELGEEKPHAVRYYLRAAEASVACGNFVGALRDTSRGVRCDPDEDRLSQLRSIEYFSTFMLNRPIGSEGGWDEAMRRLRPGSMEWCRAHVTTLALSIHAQDASRIAEQVQLLLNIEPDAEAYAIYLDALTNISVALITAAPAQVMELVRLRMVTSVELAAPKNPALRRHLYYFQAQMAMYRQARPWTLIQQGQLALKLFREVGDRISDMILSSILLPWGWLDLGDREGVRNRLLALETEMLHSPDVLLVVFWRDVLARALCDSDDPMDWAKAEELAAPLRADTGPLVFVRAYGHGIFARAALRRGQMETALEQARAAMPLLQILPVCAPPIAAVNIRALIGLGRTGEAIAVAEQLIAMLPVLGGLGSFEVEFRLSASQAFHAAGEVDRARTELRETLRQVQLRVDDISDPTWKHSYLNRNPSCVQAQALATEWGLGVVVKS